MEWRIARSCCGWGGRRRPRSSTTRSTPTHPTNVRRASSTCGEGRHVHQALGGLGAAGVYVPGPRACPAPGRLSVARADRGNQPVGGSQSPRGIATDVDMERLTLPLPARGIWLRDRSLLGLALDRCTVQFSTGKLDLCALDPTPGEGHGAAPVDGEPAVVLNNAQILCGKLQRASRSPVRDVFDVVVAGKRDPHALAIVANTRSPRDVEAIAVAWRTCLTRSSRTTRRRLQRRGV